MGYVTELNENTPLAVLGREIRKLGDILRGHTRNALRIAMDIGRVLTLAKSAVKREGRSWKQWRKEAGYTLPTRTDELYRRLDAFRARIEQALAVNPDLSIREAVKLIGTPKSRPAKPKPVEGLERWRAVSEKEKCAGVKADGLCARIAIEQLDEKVATMRLLRGAHVVPVVKLSHRPMKTFVGMKHRPHFEILDFAKAG